MSKELTETEPKVLFELEGEHLIPEEYRAKKKEGTISHVGHKLKIVLSEGVETLMCEKAYIGNLKPGDRLFDFGTEIVYTLEEGGLPYFETYIDVEHPYEQHSVESAIYRTYKFTDGTEWRREPSAIVYKINDVAVENGYGSTT